MTKEFYTYLIKLILKSPHVYFSYDHEPAALFQLNMYRLLSDSLSQKFSSTPADAELDNWLFEKSNNMYNLFLRTAGNMVDAQSVKSYFYNAKIYLIPSLECSLCDMRDRVIEYCDHCLSTNKDAWGYEWTFYAHRKHGETKDEFAARYSETPLIKRYSDFFNKLYEVATEAAIEAELDFDNEENKKELLQHVFDALSTQGVIIPSNSSKSQGKYRIGPFLDNDNLYWMLKENSIKEFYETFNKQFTYKNYQSFAHTLFKNADSPENLLLEKSINETIRLEKERKELERTTPLSVVPDEQQEAYDKREKKYFEDLRKLDAYIVENKIPQCLIMARMEKFHHQS